MKQGAGAAALVFAGVLALAGGVGWFLYEAGKQTEESTDDGSGPSKSTRKSGRSRQGTPEPIPKPVGLAAAKPPAQPDVRFEIPGHDDLKMRRWREVAISFREMAELAYEMRRLGPPDPMVLADAKRLEKMNEVTNRYQVYAINPPEGYVGAPPDPNVPAAPIAAVTSTQHPAFVVNLAAALLDRAETPLTDEQTRRLLEVGRKHSEIADRPKAPPGPEDFALELILARGSEADAFYADLFSVLTTKQAEIVSPAAYRGHVGLDPMGAGAVWSSVLRAMPFTDIEKLVDEIAECLAGSFGIPERVADLRPIVDKWARRIAIDSGDVVEISGLVRMSRGQGAVRDMLDLLHHVKDDLNPPAPDFERVRLVPIAFVPLRK